MRMDISRRAFLKAAAVAAGSLATSPARIAAASSKAPQLGRVASSWIGLYAEPTFRSERRAQVKRDSLVSLLEVIEPKEGPRHNPVWYRLPDGYAHSGNLQLVQWAPQPADVFIPPPGRLVEVAVPFTRAFATPDTRGEPLYRLYFESTHWATQAQHGKDGRVWYRLVDDLLHVQYFARAEHLRLIPPEEIRPITPDVPQKYKRIEVSLADQSLVAYEFDRPVLETKISSGIPDNTPGPNGIPTATPNGRFYIDKKMPMRHMGDGNLTSDLEAYELPGVPWVSFFHPTGVGFHGTYWHNDFGRPRSHGCINMRSSEAKWLFRWTLPEVEPHARLQVGRGTQVTVV
jgi:lipoprotein-anchoring transpeptidase ErfK/SrfK